MHQLPFFGYKFKLTNVVIDGIKGQLKAAFSRDVGVFFSCWPVSKSFRRPPQGIGQDGWILCRITCEASSEQVENVMPQVAKALEAIDEACGPKLFCWACDAGQMPWPRPGLMFFWWAGFGRIDEQTQAVHGGVKVRSCNFLQILAGAKPTEWSRPAAGFVSHPTFDWMARDCWDGNSFTTSLLWFLEHVPGGVELLEYRDETKPLCKIHAKDAFCSTTRNTTACLLTSGSFLESCQLWLSNRPSLARKLWAVWSFSLSQLREPSQ